MNRIYIFLVIIAISLQSCNKKSEQAEPVLNGITPKDTVIVNDNFEQTVSLLLNAIKTRNDRLANTLVSQYGIVIIYRTGVFNEYKTIDKIDFKNPVPQNFTYPSFDSDYKLQYEDLPKFNCGDMKWDKHGLYCDTIHKDTLLSGTPQNLIKYRGDKIPEAEVQKLKQLEAKSRRVVLAQQGKDFIFYLTLINDKWYLTAIDRITTDCSA